MFPTPTPKAWNSSRVKSSKRKDACLAEFHALTNQMEKSDSLSLLVSSWFPKLFHIRNFGHDLGFGKVKVLTVRMTIHFSFPPLEALSTLFLPFSNALSFVYSN